MRSQIRRAWGIGNPASRLRPLLFGGVNLPKVVYADACPGVGRGIQPKGRRLGLGGLGLLLKILGLSLRGLSLRLCALHLLLGSLRPFRKLGVLTAQPLNFTK